MTTKVKFMVDGLSYEVDARIPQMDSIPKEGIRVMTINNAIEDINIQYGINIRHFYSNVYTAATLYKL